MKRLIAALSAAATATLVMAALSAASASADTVICSGSPCNAPNIQPAGSAVGSGASEKGIQIYAAGSELQFECQYDLMAATSKATRGNPLAAQFYGTLGTCLQKKKTSCKGTLNSPPTTLQRSGTAQYMKIGTAAEPLAFTFTCPPESPTPTCTYKLNDTLTLDLQTEEVTALYQPMTRVEGGSASCNTSSPKLSVRNLRTGPNYIGSYSSTQTRICKTAEEPCLNESNWYGAGTPLEASVKSGTKATLWALEEIPFECPTSSIAGQLTGTGGATVPAEITSFTLNECAAYGGSSKATTTVENLPWKAQITQNNVVAFSNVKIKLVFFGITCYFGGELYAVAEGNEIVFNSISGMSMLPGSNFLCSEGAVLKGRYPISSPSPFYIGWL